MISLSGIVDKAVETYENRFGLNIQKSIDAAEKMGGLYQSNIMNTVASINFRRYASLNEQMEESFSSFKSFLIGKSLAGQNIFWEKRGEFIFRHSSMDFFDHFFKFGFLGLGLFLWILFLDSKIIIQHLYKKEGIIFGLFFLYAFFGGHVIDSVTSGSLFYFCSARISQLKRA